MYNNEFQTVLGGYENNEALCPHIWEILCVNSVENAAVDLTNTDKRVPRIYEDWLTTVEREDSDRQDINSIIQNRVRIEVNNQTGIVPTVERNGMIQPPVQDDEPLIIDLVESDQRVTLSC